jgi:protein ImuA
MDATDLHPALWRANQWGHSQLSVLPSGYAELDTHLPGGGWPQCMLTELLLSHAGVGEIRLLAPALARVQARGQCVMMFDPPERLSPWALAGLGLRAQQLLLIQSQRYVQASVLSAAPDESSAPDQQRADVGTDVGVDVRVSRWSDRKADRRVERGAERGAERAARCGAAVRAAVHRRAKRLTQQARADDTLWALEQALKSGHVGAVLAWLPVGVSAERIRRLQLAAQAHEGPAFVFRDPSWAAQPSAAPLRLALQPAGAEALSIRLLKRRGPSLLDPITVVLPPVLSAAARRRALRGDAAARGREASWADGMPLDASAAPDAAAHSGMPLPVATFVHVG